MPTEVPRTELEAYYAAAAQEYARRQNPEFFSEAIGQGTQRTITLSSLSLVHAHRPDIQFFNELRVEYTIKGRKGLRHVIPDNMVVVHPKTIEAAEEFSLETQPVAPFWVMDYVRDKNNRKDYEENREKYEQEIKVPYYLIFNPDNQELSLFQHTKRKYAPVLPDKNGLHAIAELEMAVALVDGWVRFWFRGAMVPLPNELLSNLDQERQRANQAEADRQAMANQIAAMEAELAVLRASGGRAS